MRWLLQNFRQRAAFAVRNPRYAPNSLFRELTGADEKFLAAITGTSAREIRSYLDEPVNTEEFARHLRGSQIQFRRLSINSADLYAKKVLCQYAAVWALKPRCIVETGIANGVSSAYLLLALQKNGGGSLHSVGLADPAYYPEGQEPGWFVPDWLREPWRIHLGDARDILPPLLVSLNHVDIFIHDSLHTYAHMLWEFQTAYPFLRSGGLLFADDALWNASFHDFARAVGASKAGILHGVGFLRKNSP